MLSRIIRFALNNRMVVLMLAAILMVGGLLKVEQMDVDVFPDLNAPTVTVMTEAKGMAAEEVEQLVTFPIESALNGATDVRKVRSSSVMGFSIVWVEFDWNTDIYKDRQVVSEKLDRIQELLPNHVGRPVLGPQSSILGETMIVGLSSDSLSMQDLRTLADWKVRPKLLTVAGVSQITVVGGAMKEYQIVLHPEKMQHYAVGYNAVSQAVQGLNQNASAGIVAMHGNEYTVRGIVSSSDVAVLGNTVVKNASGEQVLLHQIATIQMAAKTPKMGMASVDGKPSVLLTITKQPATNTLQLTENLDNTLEELEKTLPASVTIHKALFRQADFIQKSIDNVQKALFEGGLFVVVILFLFLMHVRTTLISLISIPISLLCALLTLDWLGMTINTMSLGGMAIAVGSLVDDAVVDVENVFKRLRKNALKPLEKQKKKLTVIYEASKEVRLPILNSTLIVCASFLPLFFLTGMEGKMLFPLGIAFLVSLFASTLVALTITPVLCSFLPTKKEAFLQWKEPLVSRTLGAWYQQSLRWAIQHQKLVFSGTALLFVLACITLPFLGRSFLPPFNEGSLTINVSTMPGVSLEESDKIGRLSEQVLLSVPEVKHVARKTGRAELDEHALGSNVSELEVPFSLKDRTKAEMVADIRQKMEAVPGIFLEIGQPISHRIDAMLSGTRANVVIKIFGQDLNALYQMGQEIKTTVADVPGLVDLNVEQQVERPQLRIIPKREVLVQYGMSVPDFSRMLGALLMGEVVSQVFEGNQTYDVTLKMNDAIPESIEQLKAMYVEVDNQLIPLGDLAEIKSVLGPNAIGRENIMRKVVVSANVEGRDMRRTVQDMQALIEKNIHLPEGYQVEFSGQFENEASASRTLLYASLGSMMLIFMLLYFQFKSAGLSLLVLLNLPLALIGGIFAVLFTGGVISIPSVIGFISLFGIATRNGLLLMTRYHDLEQSGMDFRELVVSGSLDRLNPILMTALCAALALIPLAVGGSLPGNEIQSPMAKVILGGLFSSTLLNGYVLPLLYLQFKKRRNE